MVIVGNSTLYTSIVCHPVILIDNVFLPNSTTAVTRRNLQVKSYMYFVDVYLHYMMNTQTLEEGKAKTYKAATFQRMGFEPTTFTVN